MREGILNHQNTLYIIVSFSVVLLVGSSPSSSRYVSTTTKTFFPIYCLMLFLFLSTRENTCNTVLLAARRSLRRVICFLLGSLLRSNYLRSGLRRGIRKSHSLARPLRIVVIVVVRSRSLVEWMQSQPRRPSYSFSTLPNCPPPGFRRASSARSAALKSNVHAC